MGVGQAVLVNIWIYPATIAARNLTGYKVTITKPDGSTDVVGPMTSYSGDATAWFTFVPTETGEWKLKFDFPGGYFPQAFMLILTI